MSKGTIKPIETKYRGYRFRSRLEARWAVYFDSIGVDWEYEPEGFDLGDGIWYLPDFILHNMNIDTKIGGPGTQDVYVEVKGVMTEDDAEKIRRFANKSEGGRGVDNPIYVVGNIPDPSNFPDSQLADEDHCGVHYFSFELLDGNHNPAYLCVGNDEYPGFFDDDNDHLGYINFDMTEDALIEARSTRFKYGEVHGPVAYYYHLPPTNDSIFAEWLLFLKASGVKYRVVDNYIVQYEGIDVTHMYCEYLGRNDEESINTGCIIVNQDIETRETIAKRTSRNKRTAVSVGQLPTEDKWSHIHDDQLSDWKLFYDGVEIANIDISEWMYEDTPNCKKGHLYWIEPFSAGRWWGPPKHLREG